MGNGGGQPQILNWLTRIFSAALQSRFIGFRGSHRLQGLILRRVDLPARQSCPLKLVWNHFINIGSVLILPAKTLG
jgi:hypothetical protein